MTEAPATRAQLYGLLGDLPPRQRPIAAECLAVEEHPGYRLEKLRLDLNGLEPVPAYFLRPRHGSPPWPAVLYQHVHGGDYALGKRELLEGWHGLAQPPYAGPLTAMGCCVLAIDAWNFGERSGRDELDLFKQMLWQGRVLWGMMVYDALRALDYLASRPEVDAARIATIGMSMGSSLSQWTAALDQRVAACAETCCLTDYQALLEAGGLAGHGIYYYVPALLKHFTAAGINALIAPRPHLSQAGIYDPLTPAAGLDRIDRELQQVYAHAGCPENWRLLRYPVAHEETPEMRAATLAFLRAQLQP